MTEKEALKSLLKKLFSEQRLAVLGTQSRSGPYGNLVAFAATDDLKYLLFATTRATRKFGNLTEIPKVSLLIDNRSNREVDFHEAVAVTATGIAKEAFGSERDTFQDLLLSKHPYLLEFVTAPTCALLKIEVDTYYIVREFQHVVELHIKL